MQIGKEVLLWGDRVKEGSGERCGLKDGADGERTPEGLLEESLPS